MKFVDYYLDRITMYRLVLYILIGLLVVATIYGAVGILSYSFISILLSVGILLLICWATNTLMSWAFDAHVNVESVYITALILALIISPVQDIGGVIFLGWAGILAISSKFILAIGKKHIFNPAAIAVVLTAYVLGQSASWWVGTSSMMPFVLISGVLLIRKLRYFDLAWSFFTTSFVVCMTVSLLSGGNVLNTINHLIFSSFVLFFGTIMVTEPLTIPPTKHLQMIYGAIVGFLSVPQMHIASLYFSPEAALCIGNIFAYIVSPKQKLVLTLEQKLRISSDSFGFIFRPTTKLSFVPGQYMEWTIPHDHVDSRGNRRYFTLASSPTEDTIQLGVKFYDNSSTYKKTMQNLDNKTPIVAAQIAGDFTLPKDPTQKLVLIAGGIGITPFRSMLKYLIDTNQSRTITLFYANKTRDEIAYKDVFDEAQSKLGIQTIYTLTDLEAVPRDWPGAHGRIDAQMIQTHVPDYTERIFYLSGPHAMVTAYADVLSGMGVKADHIKKDFFPGLV